MDRFMAKTLMVIFAPMLFSGYLIVGLWMGARHGIVDFWRDFKGGWAAADMNVPKGSEWKN